MQATKVTTGLHTFKKKKIKKNEWAKEGEVGFEKFSVVLRSVARAT